MPGFDRHVADPLAVDHHVVGAGQQFDHLAAVPAGDGFAVAGPVNIRASLEFLGVAGVSDRQPPETAFEGGIGDDAAAGLRAGNCWKFHGR